MFDITAIINQFKDELEKNGKTKLKMEVNVEIVDESSALHDRCFDTCSNNKTMTGLSQSDSHLVSTTEAAPANGNTSNNARLGDPCVDTMNILDNRLTDAARYLIKLYESIRNEKGDYKYSCSSTKLSKLLTLAVWIRACSNENDRNDLFLGEIISKKCGTSISGLTLDLENQDFTLGTDTDKAIEENEIYFTPTEDCYTKKLLNFVFVNFGAYHSYVLGNYINYYKPDNAKLNSAISVADFLNKYADLNSKNFNPESPLKALNLYVELWNEYYNNQQ